MFIKRYWPIGLILTLAWIATAEDAPSTSMVGGGRIAGDGLPPSAIFELGGAAMWPIFAIAVGGLVLAVERLVNLRRSRHTPRNFHKEVVKVADMRGIDAALALCLEKTSSLSRVLYCALLRQGSARQEMEYAVLDEGRRVLYDLRRNTRPIGVLALLAFLIGLLGGCVNFVLAMDEASLADASEHFAVLAAGGVKAGIPITFGLASAIVLGLLYCYVRGRAGDVARDVEEMGIEAVVTLDRKARQSIRLIEDIEEQIETQDMPGIRPPDLDKEFDESRDSSSGLKTSITTHHGLAGLAAGTASPAPSASSASASATPAPPAAPATPTPPPQNAPKA